MNIYCRRRCSCGEESRQRIGPVGRVNVLSGFIDDVLEEMIVFESAWVVKMGSV